MTRLYTFQMRIFDDYPAAFDWCRECDRPVVVIIGEKVVKLMPSGVAYEKGYTPEEVAAMRAAIAAATEEA